MQLVDMVITDYQPVIDDLMSAARDLSHVIASDNDVQLSVSYIAEKFHAIKQSVHQQRQSLDLLPCVSSPDVSHVTLFYLVLRENFLSLLSTHAEDKASGMHHFLKLLCQGSCIT